MLFHGRVKAGLFLFLVLSIGLLAGMASVKYNLWLYREFAWRYLELDKIRAGAIEGLEPLPLNELQVFGSVDGSLNRIAPEISATMPPIIKNLADQTAGIGVRFFYTGETIAITAELPTRKRDHISPLLTNGVDLYVDDSFIRTEWSRLGRLSLREELPGSAGSRRKIEIYLPAYGKVQQFAIWGKRNSIDHSYPYSSSKEQRLVIYGTSITQGCCAQNPSLIYSNLIRRKMDIDVINVGLSGNGDGNSFVLQQFEENTVDYFVLDYWANADPETLEHSLEDWITKIKEAHRDAKILVTTPFEQHEKYKEVNAQRRVIIEKVVHRHSNGDLASCSLALEDEELLDAIHPNDRGHQSIASQLKECISGLRVE